MLKGSLLQYILFLQMRSWVLFVETRFTGTLEYLPSANNGTWNIFSKIYVEVNIESPLAVEQLTTINGFVGDNMLNPLSGMLVVVTVEGITIGNATTDSNGNYSFNWQVPNIFPDGNHTVQQMFLPKIGTGQVKEMQHSS